MNKVVGISIGLVVILLIAMGAFYMISTGGAPRSGADQSSGWFFDGNTWRADGNPPACQEPLVINPPTDVSKATSLLYPGQYRTGGYKTHGGFRFDGTSTNSVTVVAPMDAQLVKASRYIEAGEVQYLMFFTHPCGIIYRLDHLLTLSPKWQQVMDKLPPAQVDDSRTTEINPPVPVTAGEILATAVGFKNSRNVSFDFGVTDLRQPNTISKNPTWAAQHTDDKEFAPYAICWLNYLPANAKTIVKNLPASGNDSKQSDYCS